MRHIIFGDIHGNYLGVESILAKADYNPVEDIIVCTGDYCDHFSEQITRSTKKTLDLLCRLQAQSPDRTFFVLGNHDLWFRKWLMQGGLPEMIWYSQGGMQTLSSYLGREPHYKHMDLEEARDAISADHEYFLYSLLQYHIDNKIVCMHGGFPYELVDQVIIMQAVKKGLKLNIMQENDILWDREFWQGGSVTKERFRDHFGNRYMITGHTQARYSRFYEPVPGPFIDKKNRKWINIDSPGLHAVIIHNDTYKIVGQNKEWGHADV